MLFLGLSYIYYSRGIFSELNELIFQSFELSQDRSRTTKNLLIRIEIESRFLNAGYYAKLVRLFYNEDET